MVTVRRKVSGLFVIGYVYSGRTKVGLSVVAPVRVTLSGSVGLARTCSHKYVAPTVVEPTPVRVTVLAVVLRTTVWSEPALATTAPRG